MTQTFIEALDLYFIAWNMQNLFQLWFILMAHISAAAKAKEVNYWQTEIEFDRWNTPFLSCIL